MRSVISKAGLSNRITGGGASAPGSSSQASVIFSGPLAATFAYCFEGRLAHQTLGMLVTRRMERAGFGPLGYLATDYVLAAWSAFEPSGMDELFSEDILGEDLEEWMAESSMLRRTFRNIATVAGLIEKNHPGQEKSGRQMTMNADLIYDVLRKHEPDHVLLRATRLHLDELAHARERRTLQVRQHQHAAAR